MLRTKTRATIGFLVGGIPERSPGALRSSASCSRGAGVVPLERSGWIRCCCTEALGDWRKDGELSIFLKELKKLENNTACSHEMNVTTSSD